MEAIEQAKERVEAYAAQASGMSGAQTTQTRLAIAIMRELGIARDEFSVRTKLRNGVYDYAMVSLKTPGAAWALGQRAEEAAALGMTVHLNEDAGRAMVAAVHPGRRAQVFRKAGS